MAKIIIFPSNIKPILTAKKIGIRFRKKLKMLAACRLYLTYLSSRTTAVSAVHCRTVKTELQNCVLL